MPRTLIKYFIANLVLFFICIYPAKGLTGVMPQYNRLTFMRFTAKVESVNTLKNPNIGRMGLHLFARDSADNFYLVHICPQWYANKHPELFMFNKGDQLIISGSRFMTNLTANNIFAATIINCSQDNQQVNIRDPFTGIPLWNNQPDHLVEKIQLVQQQVFLGNSRFIQQNVAKNIARFQAQQIKSLQEPLMIQQ